MQMRRTFKVEERLSTMEANITNLFKVTENGLKSWLSS